MIDKIMAGISGSELAVLLLIVALMLAFAEIGYPLGLRLHATKDAARK